MLSLQRWLEARRLHITIRWSRPRWSMRKGKLIDRYNNNKYFSYTRLDEKKTIMILYRTSSFGLFPRNVMNLRTDYGWQNRLNTTFLSEESKRQIETNFRIPHPLRRGSFWIFTIHYLSLNKKISLYILRIFYFMLFAYIVL